MNSADSSARDTGRLARRDSGQHRLTGGNGGQGVADQAEQWLRQAVRQAAREAQTLPQASQRLTPTPEASGERGQGQQV